jgi:hypothetical protein
LVVPAASASPALLVKPPAALAAAVPCAPVCRRRVLAERGQRVQPVELVREVGLLPGVEVQRVLEPLLRRR